MEQKKLILVGMTLAAATPTLFIPVDVWHHHDDDDTTEHEHCAVCLLPPMIALVEPATATVAAPQPQLRIKEQTPLRVDTIRWFPIRSRAPPAPYSLSTDRAVLRQRSCHGDTAPPGIGSTIAVAGYILARFVSSDPVRRLRQADKADPTLLPRRS